MNTKATIRKILIAIFWISVGGGMLTLLIAAIGKKNREVCADYSISIKGSQDNLFIDEKDISKLLTSATNSDIKGKKISELNLDQLEQLLEDNIWISDAEMWFDNRNVLRVSVIEREPIARIFTNEGYSFYIDSSIVLMPLSDKLSARVPVFTGFTSRDQYTSKDSLLLNDIKTTAQYILSDPFLQSQVAQIDITEENKFEMIPVIGNHLVKLGDGKDMDKKFINLKLFYKQVLGKSGFDIYNIVDVQFAGQVVGTKRGKEKGYVDMVKLRMNVEKLLNKVQKMQIDSVVIVKPIIEKPIIKEDQKKETTTSLLAPASSTNDPNTVKTTSLPKENENKSEENKPKAVMPKKKN